ncbi:MAG: hypothetical protein AAFY11_01325 [Cyanobacteria bacterium J06641_5]
MKDMRWVPESKDEKVNQYLDSINHEPWLAIFAVSLLLVSALAVLIGIGSF